MARSAGMLQFPTRDDDGRVLSLVELVGAVLAALVLGLLLLLVVDGVSDALGFGEFGTSSGWLAGILPVWLYVEDFRAWRGVRGRVGVLLVALAVAALLAFSVGATVGALPNLLAGAVAVSAGALAFAPLWYLGIRMVDSRTG